MSLTNRQYLGTVLLRNIEGTFSSDELDSFISQEGDVKLAQAAAYEVEASRVSFSFSAGDTSADKSKYHDRLVKMAQQIRADHAAYAADASSTTSWSGSAWFGTAELGEYVDEQYNETDQF